MMSGDDHTPDRPTQQHTIAKRDSSTQSHDRWENPDDLAPGTSLIGKRLRIAGETMVIDGHVVHAEDCMLEVHRHLGELQLTIDGRTYRIQDTMNVDVGRSIVSANITNNVVTIVTNNHGTAHVDRCEVERIVHILRRSPDAVVRVAVSTQFAPEGAVLCSAIGFCRMCRGWKPGDSEIYDIGFEVVEPDQALAMARPN